MGFPSILPLPLLLLLLGTGWLLWERCGLAGCPDVDRLAAYRPGGASVLVDRNGEAFGNLTPVDRELVPLDSLPDHLGEAFVAVEDRRFFRHDGVDWTRVLGAAWADLRAGALVEGSSTITMQLSRTLFAERIRREEKTFRRKLLEVRMAGEIEDRFTKDQILELYLNHVYLGGGASGVQAASRYYFGKDAAGLETEEAALLAALTKAPALFDPWGRAEQARARRDLVLTLMERQGRLPSAQARAARARRLGVAAEPDRRRHGQGVAPYFVQQVRRLLEEELGGGVYTEPLRVVTTLDLRAQEAAREELEAGLRAVDAGAFGRLVASSHDDSAVPGREGTDQLQGAVVLMDAKTGEIRAWVGGRDYGRSRFDRARLARRQAGSAFKPFVYAAALEEGFSLSQPILDEPLPAGWAGRGDWRPENYSGEFEGLMSMREALVRSQNIPSIRLAAAVGDDRVRDLAGRTGLTGDVPASPVAALGVTTVSPLEMAVAYASFAGGGARPTPRFVTRVEDADGEVLLETEPARTQVTDRATAFLMTDVLRDVVDRGTGAGVRRAGFQGPTAGKTGTTDGATDVWFAGYTPELVGVVWVGFDAVRPLPPRATGGGVAAPVWGRIMARLPRGRSAPGWEAPPANVVVRSVDPTTGLVLEEGCRPRRGESGRELFLEGQGPATTCPHRGGRGFLAQVGGWLERVFGSSDPAAGIPGEPDPDLGVPRLPRRGEADPSGVGTW